MADNYVTNAGSGGDTFAADDIGGTYKIPRVKVVLGADGTNDGDVASGNPLPISAASLPLPSGAATAAKQPALGTAGTPSADVITVQGTGSMTALKVDGSAVTQPVSGTVSITANSSVNVNQIGGNAVSAGNGASGTGVLRVTIANDSTGVVGLSAGTNLVGRVSSSDETSTIYNATTALTPKFAAVSAASSGNNTLISAVVGKKVRVLAMNLVGAAAQVNTYITDGAGGSAIWAGSTNKASLAQYGGFVLPYNPVGWFETSSNTALVLNLSGATAIGGSITYVEV